MRSLIHAGNNAAAEEVLHPYSPGIPWGLRAMKAYIRGMVYLLKSEK
jgi:hypothetical protein